jgi:hypothetical protein
MNNQYQQPFVNQTGMRPMYNVMPMQQQSQYPYPPQMPIQSSPRNKQMIRPPQQMMMISPYEGQIMNPYMNNMPQNVSVQKSSMSKSRTSLAERQNQSVAPQQQWYPQQGQMNNSFMMNQPLMNTYGMRPSAPSAKNPNFYQQPQQPQQYINGSMPYQQSPMGYNVGAQNYRPQKIQSRPQQSTIPTLPMINNSQMMNNQMLNNQMMNSQMMNNQMMGDPSIMNSGQINGGAYGNFGQANPNADRPRSNQRKSRPSSASSQLSSNGSTLPIHNTSFRTGNNKQNGRRTPVDKRSALTLTTHERYMKNSRGSLAALDYETYDLDDWKRQKNRDGNMKLPAGLGHTETNEWKNKVIFNNKLLA